MKYLNEVKRMQQLAGINEIKIDTPGNNIVKLSRNKMIQDMWNYDDEGFWEDAGYDRTNINTFGDQFNDSGLIANYFDINGDFDPSKKYTLDGKDITKEIEEYKRYIGL